MDSDEVQETNLDEVEVDVDGNLRPLELHDTEGGSHEPLHPEYAAGSSSNDYLTRQERRSLERQQSKKNEYAKEGSHDESVPMAVGDTGRDRDDLSSSSGSYLGLGEGLHDYPELAATAVNNLGSAANEDPDQRASSSGAAVVMHDIELSVYDRPGASDAHAVERGEPPEPKRPRPKNLAGLLDLIVTFFTESSPQKLAIFFAIVAVIVGLLLMVGLLPASFVYIEYYELALAKNKITGSVNRDDVYYPGCYLLTPNIELVRFQGTAHILDLTVDVSTSDKLSLNLGITLQYFIKPAELGQLHRDYEFDYPNVVKRMVISSIKNRGVIYSLDHYRLHRLDVENDLRQTLAYKLGGDCCPACCPSHCGSGVDCRSCRLSGRCSSQGIHMEMKYFQMGGVDIPEDVTERFLRRTILQIEAEKEVYVQQHAVETKISELQQKKILNEAAEIKAYATAAAYKIKVAAEAEYEKKVQEAYVQALKQLYSRLNITQEDHKLSLMYVRALEDISDNLYNLNYDQHTLLGSP